MSFRQYGGTNYASRNNIIKNHYTNASNLSVMNKVGQSTSIINSDSDLNINGNLRISGVNGIYFPDGSFQNTAYLGLSGGSYYNAPSDYRIKENVELISSKFTIDNLRPVTYTNILSGKQDMGFIAHELHEHFPFLVTGEKDGPVTQSVNYIGLIALLVKEIQELKQDIKILKMK